VVTSFNGEAFKTIGSGRGSRLGGAPDSLSRRPSCILRVRDVRKVPEARSDADVPGAIKGAKEGQAATALKIPILNGKSGAFGCKLRDIMLHLVPPPRSPEALTCGVYSEKVCRAIAKIRRVQSAEEAAMDSTDRRDLGAALRLLGVAALLEAQIAEAEAEGDAD
jgi:hypothetical protein